VAELKASELYACSKFKLEPNKRNDKEKQIIDADPSATIATTNILKNKPKNHEAWERLFHSHMWVEDSPL